MTIECWKNKQDELNIRMFDSVMKTRNPESTIYTSDPEKYFNRVCVDCNYLNAVKLLDWNSILPYSARIIDLAGGIGWLSAYLSTFSKVSNIKIIDVSREYLENNVPVSITKLSGNAQKVHFVEGLFFPLLLDNGSIDLVVASSALHHAEKLEPVLQEIHRVLINGGRCLILNETPLSYYRHVIWVIKQFTKIIGAAIFSIYCTKQVSVFPGGVYYDPLLGDRAYPDWHWRKAINHAGFKLERVVKTGMSTVKGLKGQELVHYICKK